LSGCFKKDYGKVVGRTNRCYDWGRLRYRSATARLYAKHGANVVVSDLNERAATEIVSGIQSDGGKAVFIKADVSKASECENLVQQTLKTFGRVDIAF